VPVIAAAALAALCASPPWPPPPPPPVPFYWPRPDVVEEIDIPDTLKADGVPVRLHIMRSKMGVQGLLSAFATAFTRAGFWVPRVQKRIVAEPHVTGLDWRRLISYSAILHPNPDGTVTCVLGEAQLGKRQTPAAVPDIAPLFPIAQDVLRVDDERSRVISYVVRGPTAEELVVFYRERLPRAGWRPAEDGSWEKSGARLSVMTQPTGDGAVSVVLVQTLGGATEL
jgi:hypothetical protein